MIRTAARSGDCNALQDCIDKGADVNYQDEDNNVSNIVYRTHLKIIKINIV